MALSNWDTIAFNDDGQSCNGTVVSEHGDSIKIYKNWIYVRSPDMWKKAGARYIEPTIAEVWEGNIKLAGFNIEAIRGPQNGIFVYVEHGPWENRQRFAGIGCSGYRDRLGEYLKANNIQVTKDDMWVESSGCGNEEDPTHWQYSFENITCRDENGNNPTRHVYHDEATDGPYDYSADWLGVKKETVQEFLSWLENRESRKYPPKGYFEWLDIIKNTEHLRFNQGDAFFIGAENAASNVGSVKPTILSQVIKSMGDRSDD